jgi:hypothetical protein
MCIIDKTLHYCMLCRFLMELPFCNLWKSEFYREVTYYHVILRVSAKYGISLLNTAEFYCISRNLV